MKYMDKLRRKISHNNKILQYLHCKMCLTSKPLGVSMAEWGGYEVGWTKLGLQVWCKKHNANILHIDFQKQQHPANLTCKPSQNDK